MKTATFKKTYTTNTIFDNTDFAQLINDASNQNGIKFKNKQQFTDLCNLDQNGNLSMYLEQNNYNLTYYGLDSSSNHIFKIENGTKELELSMTDEYFGLSFTVE